MNQNICELNDIITNSNNIVFFGGAGVSTESGIPDFRSADGLYNQKYQYPPETILSHTFFINHTKEFYDFYREKLIYLEAKPNAAHDKLAELEKAGKLKAVITQNIDGLHQAAGSVNVLELHGSVHRNICENCGRVYSAQYILQTNDIPKCECGGIIKPDVVLYEEPLNSIVLDAAVTTISKAEVLIIGGTSLNVYPAAGLVNYYKGNKLIVINRTTTSYDHKADIIINGNIGEVLRQISF